MTGDNDRQGLVAVGDIGCLLQNLAADALTFIIDGDLIPQFYLWMSSVNLLPPRYTQQMFREDLETIYAAATGQPHPRVDYPRAN